MLTKKKIIEMLTQEHREEAQRSADWRDIDGNLAGAVTMYHEGVAEGVRRAMSLLDLMEDREGTA